MKIYVIKTQNPLIFHITLVLPLSHLYFPFDCCFGRSQFIFSIRVWMCVCVCLCACVCSSTVMASSVSKMSETYFRGTDQRSWIVNINLGASAKLLHLRIGKCHISPSKTKTPASTNWRENDIIYTADIKKHILIYRSSHPEVFLGKSILKICSKFTGEHPYWSLVSIKLLWNFIEIALQHGCSPVNLLHIFRTSFLKNTLPLTP